MNFTNDRNVAYSWDPWTCHYFLVLDTSMRLAVFACDIAAGIPHYLTITKASMDQNFNSIKTLPIVGVPSPYSKFWKDVGRLYDKFINQCIKFASQGVWYFDFNEDVNKYAPLAGPMLDVTFPSDLLIKHIPNVFYVNINFSHNSLIGKDEFQLWKNEK